MKIQRGQQIEEREKKYPLTVSKRAGREGVRVSVRVRPSHWLRARDWARAEHEINDKKINNLARMLYIYIYHKAARESALFLGSNYLLTGVVIACVISIAVGSRSYACWWVPFVC